MDSSQREDNVAPTGKRGREREGGREGERERGRERGGRREGEREREKLGGPAIRT